MSMTEVRSHLTKAPSKILTKDITRLFGIDVFIRYEESNTATLSH